MTEQIEPGDAVYIKNWKLYKSKPAKIVEQKDWIDKAWIQFALYASVWSFRKAIEKNLPKDTIPVGKIKELIEKWWKVQWLMDEDKALMIPEPTYFIKWLQFLLPKNTDEPTRRK